MDGYIAGPHGEYDWCFTDQDYGMKEFLTRVDTTLMGRKTFEVLLKNGEATFSGLKNYVFSKTLEPALYKDVTVVSLDPISFTNKLRCETGKDLWLFGGGTLIQTFLEVNLIDELVLSIHPIILGDGIPLFYKTSHRLNFLLIDCKTYPTGLIQSRYGKYPSS